MVPIVELERAALRLRHHLKIAVLPELKLLCGLRFFASFPENDFPGRESYLREFIPALADAAGKSNPSEFLPEEQEQLERLATLLRSQPEEIVTGSDKSAFDALCAEFNSLPVGVGRDRPGRVAAVSDRGRPQADESACVRCLFVEHNPDLDLPPRGRALNLCVTASRISSKTADDDIVVRNPVNEPDDRFLEQARQSVTAARAYLARRFGLSQKKRYRFDFVIDSTGARLTGDSLGVAFAVGAIAAVGKIEVFRERLTISDEAVFTGALTPEGKLESIDSAALKLKTYRALHSGLKYLVIPREHITDAWQYAAKLEARFPGRRLELVGAETLDAVVSDPRLVPTERLSVPAHLACKAWQAKRSTWVEIPALVALAAILFFLLAPARWLPWFDWRIDHLEVMGNRFKTVNRVGKTIWVSEEMKYVLNESAYDNKTISIARKYLAKDIDNDNKDELYFIQAPFNNEQIPCVITLYDHEGKTMWTRPIFEITAYDLWQVEDISYTTGYLTPIILNDDESCILTVAYASYPARMQVMLYGVDGRKISGPYLHTGHDNIVPSHVIDIDRDGREEVVIAAYNRRCRRAALLVLDPTNMVGVSPPYDDDYFRASGMPRGSQKAYVLFSQTDLLKEGEATCTIGKLKIADTGNYYITVLYGDGLFNGAIKVSTGGPFPPIPLDFVLDENFVPTDILVPDHTITYFNLLFAQMGIPLITDVKRWLDELESDIIVYHGNSIVDHPAAGIYYYRK